jgi:hypothetical protein
MESIMVLRNSQALCDRFGLKNGQVFSDYTYKNLWWQLDNGASVIFFGFGDLRRSDILHIQLLLSGGETFKGWHENHGTPLQRSNVPIVQISSDGIKTRRELEDEMMENLSTI